jgi:hypothetical protein
MMAVGQGGRCERRLAAARPWARLGSIWARVAAADALLVATLSSVVLRRFPGWVLGGRRVRWQGAASTSCCCRQFYARAVRSAAARLAVCIGLPGDA